MKDLGGTLKVPQSSTKILNFGPEFVKLSTLKAKKKKNSPKISPNFNLPKLCSFLSNFKPSGKLNSRELCIKKLHKFLNNSPKNLLKAFYLV